MTAVLDIWNSALAAIGTRSDVAGPDENSAEARACRLQYDQVLRQAHRAAYWNFCRKYANLALLKALPGTPENQTSWNGIWSPDLPPPPWLYTYITPNDCLAMRYVISTSYDNGQLPMPTLMTGVQIYNPYTQRPARWQKGIDLQNNKQISTINTNERMAIACYTVFVPDPNLWDEDFKQVVIDGLASQITMQLTGDKAMERQRIQDANATILNARVRDGNEGLTVMDVIPDWIEVRGGYPISAGVLADGYAYEYGPLFG